MGLAWQQLPRELSQLGTNISAALSQRDPQVENTPLEPCGPPVPSVVWDRKGDMPPSPAIQTGRQQEGGMRALP